MPYDDSRGWFRGEADFPGPRTMAAAAKWPDENAGHHDRFFLFVDEFDPHEPFDTPEPWASKYDPDWAGPHLIWPPYMQGAITKGVLTERQARQLRACYGGKLSMIDHWFGTVLDAIDRNGLAADTVVILCTDHGHYLGEKDIWGKPGVPVYETLGHIPLMIRWPGVLPAPDVPTLTTSVTDIHATLLELFGVTQRQQTHGKSLAPLLNGAATRKRDWLLTGVWGREVHSGHRALEICARAHWCQRAARQALSNRWSTMPTHVLDRHLALPLPDQRAFLDWMPGSDVPVIHQRWEAGDAVPFWARFKPGGHHLFDLEKRPRRDERTLAGSPEEEALAGYQRREILQMLQVLTEQPERLGPGRRNPAWCSPQPCWHRSWLPQWRWPKRGRMPRVRCH